MAIYTVNVGNIGEVYNGENIIIANVCFDAYIDMSKSNYGRYSNEPVYLMVEYNNGNDDILREYTKEDIEENIEENTTCYICKCNLPTNDGFTDLKFGTKNKDDLQYRLCDNCTHNLIDQIENIKKDM